jgi:hypothetical protein
MDHLSGIRRLLWGVGSAAALPGPVWAHSPTGGIGAAGWSDEVALIVGPLLFLLAVGWMTLDDRRRARKSRKGGRTRGARRR